jgi:hypothetical protein
MSTFNLEDFYSYAEKNIRGYKRPADYATRLEKIKQRQRKPARETTPGKYNEY